LPKCPELSTRSSWNLTLLEMVTIMNENFRFFVIILFLSNKRTICFHDAADPAQQVFATYNGMGMPIGIKISDQMATQGGEAVSLACTQAMQDGYKKSQTISK
jgi:hypothetical protein